jgi:hypothetical protein
MSVWNGGLLALVLAGCAAATSPQAGPHPSATLVMTLPAVTDPRPSFDYFGGLRFDDEIPTPRDVLGYDIGDHFTRHADLGRYLETLAAASDRVRLEPYGWTHERRSLGILTISDPENLARLDEILAANRRLADPDATDVESILEGNPAIVWFSYNVHGNEPSGTEAALQLAYTLAAATNSEMREILENVVVVIDPLLNPDGRERYVSWYQSVTGSVPLENPDAAEHDEPWPGGRTNHYYFDLNRDWLWLVQPESRQRLQAYRRYLPQLHIDHHEQGYRNPFFLGAGEDPYNANIPEQTIEWIRSYGNANARAFDGEGLVYSTRERFDYLYPGYGKVLPIYHGAVGMLVEQAGHSRAGLAINVDDEYTLTLRDRAYHHWLVSMSNLEMTATRRREQLERFREFFLESVDPATHETWGYIIDGANDPALLEKLWNLCRGHGIRVDRLDESATVTGLSEYRFGETLETADLPAGSWVIRTAQPMGRLVNAVLERESVVTDPDTYDITSWSLPVKFGLHAYYAAAPLDVPMSPLDEWSRPAGAVTGEGDVALLVDARQFDFAAAAGLAAKHELAGRVAGERFTVDGREFAAGSLVIHRLHNDREALEDFVDDVTARGLNVHRVASGLTEDGPALGANRNRRFVHPKVVLVRGEPTSSNSFGQMWHLLDLAAPIPYSPVNVESLGRIDLDEYNVIVVPDAGRLSGAVSSSMQETLRDWVRAGGVIVATGGSAAWASRAILDLESPDDDSTESEEDGPLSDLTWEERRDRSITERVPGTSLRVTVDTTHPLAAGVPSWLGVIKRGRRLLPVSDAGFVVARFDEQPRIGGVISEKNEERLAQTPLMTHHRLGRGSVICLSEDVTFRGFQHASMRLLLNAIVYGPGL